MSASRSTKYTAIKRSGPSAPLRWLMRNETLKKPILDYGCGREGGDTEYLNCVGWDPHWRPDEVAVKEDGAYKTILCTYVLNSVTPTSEKFIMKDIDRLLMDGGVAYLTVRRDRPVGHGSNRQRYVVLDLPVLKENTSFCIYKMEKKDGKE